MCEPDENVTLLSYTLERLLVCGVCYEEFRDFHDAQAHLFTHTNKKIFSCQLHIFGEKLNRTSHETAKQNYACKVSAENLPSLLHNSPEMEEDASYLDDSSCEEVFPLDSSNEMQVCSSMTEEQLNVGETTEEILITDEIEICTSAVKREEQNGSCSNTKFSDSGSEMSVCTATKEHEEDVKEVSVGLPKDRYKVLRQTLLRAPETFECKFCGKGSLFPEQKHLCSHVTDKHVPVQKLTDVVEVNNIETGFCEKSFLCVNENESANYSKTLACSQNQENDLPAKNVHLMSFTGKASREETLAFSSKLKTGISFVTYTNTHLFCCGICNKKFEKLNDIHEHLQAHLQEGSICGLCASVRVITRCGTNTAKSKLLLVHAKKKPYMCQLCRKTFLNMYALEVHIIIHVPMENDRLPCKMCGSTFLTMRHLKQHTSMHNNLNQCLICHLIFPDLQSMYEHEMVHRRKNFICKPCKVSFVLESSLTKHTSIHHKLMRDICRRGGEPTVGRPRKE